VIVEIELAGNEEPVQVRAHAVPLVAVLIVIAERAGELARLRERRKAEGKKDDAAFEHGGYGFPPWVRTIRGIAATAAIAISTNKTVPIIVSNLLLTCFPVIALSEAVFSIG